MSPAPSFCSVGGAGGLRRQPWVRHRGSAPTPGLPGLLLRPFHTRAMRLKLRSAPALPGLGLGRMVSPISPHSHQGTAPMSPPGTGLPRAPQGSQGTQVSLRALPSTFPGGKFWRRGLCSIHLKSLETGISGTGIGTQQGVTEWTEVRRGTPLVPSPQ